MKFADDLSPPADLTPSGSLEAEISADVTGERTRRVAAYFETSERSVRTQRLRSTDSEEREFAQSLGDAFAAARRVVIATWGLRHGKELSM